MTSPSASSEDLRRRLPSVDQALQDDTVRALAERFGRALVIRHLRALLDEARQYASSGDTTNLDAILSDLSGHLTRRLERATAPSLVKVINATGVVVHTNLGRAPLSPDAAARVAAIVASYSNLEFDLATGARGDREVHAEARLAGLLGAEATVVVNNCAAAVLLAVNTFAEGFDVIVSRGELVEIGGSFRIPEVLRKGGAKLREVGTTNKTRLADYEAAISPATGMILKVHRSNFDIVGFTESPTCEELVGLARSAGLPLAEDLGSGLLHAPHALLAEPTVPSCLRAGVDVVAFSGDKLLGGPQAGILAGTGPRIGALRRNPLYRALRVDKMTLAALDVVLADHESGRAVQRVPVLRMAAFGIDELRARANALAVALRDASADLDVVVSDGSSAIGGGAAPSLELPTALVTIAHSSLGPDRVAAALRAGEPPVVVRVAEGRVVVDLRTVLTDEEPLLLKALVRAVAPR